MEDSKLTVLGSPKGTNRRAAANVRCRAEAAAVEAQIRAGYPDLRGLLVALADWNRELRLLEKEVNDGASSGED